MKEDSGFGPAIRKAMRMVAKNNRKTKDKKEGAQSFKVR